MMDMALTLAHGRLFCQECQLTAKSTVTLCSAETDAFAHDPVACGDGVPASRKQSATSIVVNSPNTGLLPEPDV